MAIITNYFSFLEKKKKTNNNNRLLFSYFGFRDLIFHVYFGEHLLQIRYAIDLFIVFVFSFGSELLSFTLMFNNQFIEYLYVKILKRRSKIEDCIIDIC